MKQGATRLGQGNPIKDITKRDETCSMIGATEEEDIIWKLKWQPWSQLESKEVNGHDVEVERKCENPWKVGLDKAMLHPQKQDGASAITQIECEHRSWTLTPCEIDAHAKDPHMTCMWALGVKHLQYVGNIELVGDEIG